MAKARSAKDADAFKRDLTLHWLNAKLQRTKTIPKLEKLTRENKPPSFRDVVERIRSAPTAVQQE